MQRQTVALIAMLVTSGCVTTGYTLVEPGAHLVGELSLQTDEYWNLAGTAFTPSSRAGSQTWTQDGLLLDRFVVIPAVPSGEPILKSNDKTAALPVFRADMLPNEIEELVESSIVKLYGEGATAVSTRNLRPQRFGDERGFMFDIEAAVSESPNYRGVVGAFIAADRLYLMMFLGAEPHYYEKHLAAATATIESARLLAKSAETP